MRHQSYHSRLEHTDYMVHRLEHTELEHSGLKHTDYMVHRFTAHM